MAIWRRKQSTDEQPSNAGSGESWGYQAVVTLISTRLDAPASFEAMKGFGVAPALAVRYLDLAVAVAARQLLGTMSDRVELPDFYDAKLEIPSLTTNFAQCLIATELVGVYAVEPTAVTLLAPLAPDVVAINQALNQHADGKLRLGPPAIGDGSQVGFARRTFGDEGVLKLAELWPSLA